MEEKTPPETVREDNTISQEALRPPPRPHDALNEPEEMGGDSPCWAHMLDEEGRLSDRLE
jgi:hypothetical protein